MLKLGFTWGVKCGFVEFNWGLNDAKWLLMGFNSVFKLLFCGYVMGGLNGF